MSLALTSATSELFHMVQRIMPEWKEPHIFRRQLFRANVPFAKGTSTGVHYDQLFLRAGPPNALTAWVPIGDCPPMSGGLMYLEDSLGLGEMTENRFTEMSKEKGLTDAERLSAFNSNVCFPQSGCGRMLMLMLGRWESTGCCRVTRGSTAQMRVRAKGG